MLVEINITQNIKKQFEYYFKLEFRDGEYRLHPSIGGGNGMKFLEFPGRMEFYHFKKSSFKIPVKMKSVNPRDSEWFLLHINLSKKHQNKTANNENIKFQKHLPIGILLYGPGLEIETQLPPNVEMELASIHFHRSFLDTYFDDWTSIIDTSKNLIYEDLDYSLENALDKSLKSIDNKMICHADVLSFIDLFLTKLKQHSTSVNHHEIHASDMKNLFAASALLRDPLSPSSPSIAELAAVANMSKTKFKTLFKQFFGTAPLQYRTKIIMEYAREELVARRKNASELAHELGYSSPSNFTAAFKRYFDRLPSSY